MTVTLVFLALLMAAFTGWLISQSINVRPWVAQSADSRQAHHWPARLSAPRLGLGVFLAVATSLFALSVSAYLSRVEYGTDWTAVPEPGLLWVNTAVLLLASITLQGAWNAAGHGDQRRTVRRLAVGGLLSLAFIGGQYLVWRQLGNAGFHVGANPANAYFYLLTGLHAAHLLGGLAAWSWPLARLVRGGSAARQLPVVELCAVYWHYLFVVWVALFAVLLSS